MSAALVAEIASAISHASGAPFRVTHQSNCAGGCINRSMVLQGEGRRFFVKLNQAALIGMFEAEVAGLVELIAAQVMRVPVPLTHGVAGDQSFLVMEWLDLSHGGAVPWARFGEQIARLHRVTWHSFGWQRDNTIGSTLQTNPPTDNWLDFYREQRLRPQLDLAAEKGAPRYLLQQGHLLLASLDALFEHYKPQPSLLHGDLWRGNVGCCAGEAALFDPAVYFGDRETDIAMTELFGGFPASFYAAYQAVWPLDVGYATRRDLYQLYHLLNHFNLFGAAYATQSQAAIGRLLAALR